MTEPATCNAPGNFQWAFNSLGQSPCTIAATLATVCSGANAPIPALVPGDEYLGPPSNATPCQCSSVFYSLVSACAVCQSGVTIRWSTYSTNCTSSFLQTFPRPIPPGTAVPHYAYENVLITDGFDVSTAEADIGDPESTAVPTPTTVPAPSTVPTTSVKSSNSSSPNIQTPGKTSNTGGIVGGVVFLAVVAGLAFWWIRRRRARRAPIPTPASDEYVKLTSYNYTASALPQTSRIYDPLGPSTFPPTGPSSGIFRTAQTVQQETTQTTGGRAGYTGIPEI